MADPMINSIGCNTLYPEGRLTHIETQFTLPAQICAVENLAAAGFKSVEFSHIEYLVLSDVEKLRQATLDAKLEPWSVHSWVNLPAERAETERTLSGLWPTVDRCAALGARVIVLHPGGHMLSHEGATAHSRRMTANLGALRPLCERAAKSGISIAVENCGPLEDLEFILELVRVSGAKNAGFCIDTGHARIFGVSPAEAILRMGNRLLTTHLQDTFGRRDDHLAPGLGVIDWVSVFAALRQIGYLHPAMVELSDCPPSREPEAQKELATAFQNVKKFMAAANGA